MSTDQWDPAQVVRIRMRCVHAITGVDHPVWSDRLPRRLAETDIALGPEHLALEHAGGLLVLSAAIVIWTYD
jgi:hypothetical protein